MKWWTFKFLLLYILCQSITVSALSQTNDSVLVNSKYEKRVERYYSFWNKLIPSYSKIQYAGSMGVVSIGPGWDYGKNNQWETDLMLGIIPKYSTNKTKVTLTLKQNFIPWNVHLGGKGFSLDPLACGLYLNTVFGHEFWTKEPGRYPKGYYGFSTRLRFNIYLGQRVTYQIPPQKRSFIKAISAYYEVSSSDLYIISAATNSYLKPKDYLHLSLGVKLLFL